ncbi:sugar ABC transporter substrate-binding protein [Actinacidiphila glaucinigra]|uniref:sugar ABC transporter substrate-binding protein n=1 Tax=Actinacidiphila glaucinigra TaxID=235986 RepID=UPI00366CB028
MAHSPHSPHLHRPTRRSLLLAGAAVPAAALLTGCGDDGGGEGKGDGTLHMGIAVANISLNFAAEMVSGAKSAAAHAGGVDFKAVGPPNTDGPAEAQLFQNLTTTAKDGVVLENLDPPIFVRPAAQAIERGVPVVALDTAPLDGSKVTFYVGNDNYDMGATLAEEALKRLPADPAGTVVVGVPNPGTPVLDSRAEGIRETFAAKAPRIKVLGPFQTYSDPAQNYGAWLAQVHANPGALAFLGVGDADSYNLGRIKTKEKGAYLVAGADVDVKTLEYVKSGANFCTVDPEHFLKGYIATAVLIDTVRKGGELPDGWFRMPGLVVDSSNVDEIIARQKSGEAAYRWYKPQIDDLLAHRDAHMRPLKDER